MLRRVSTMGMTVRKATLASRRRASAVVISAAVSTFVVTMQSKVTVREASARASMSSAA